MNNLIDKKPMSTELAPIPNFGFDCASFFSMHKTPFTLTPKKTHIYTHENYKHAKNTLLFGISSGEKLLKITGNVGVGKTLLINDVLSSIDHQHYPVRILNPKISSRDLLCQIIDEFGLAYPIDATIEQLMRFLRFTLHEHYAQTEANILVWIDDAHNLSNDTLLIIDKISSWSTPNRALLQFIISGANELDQRLDHQRLSSMKNNIRFSDTLKNINKNEIGNYVSSCIQSHEKHDEPQFTPSALKQLYKCSDGNPSAINKLAYKSLLVAYGNGLRTITHHYVNTAFSEQDKETEKPENKKLYFTLSAWACINVVLAIAFFGGYL
ncbi:MAG: AAA family ATPase [Gammaproteobacteria bacterium]|nr:AAA family ATPase [Gammaproteobacteria bacterium]